MLLLFCANALYEVTRAALEGNAAVALEHARDIVRTELLGITGYRACRHLVTGLVWAAYPALVVFAIVVTGNRLLDAVAGAAVLAIAWAIVTQLPRAADRPAAPPGPAARSVAARRPSPRR